MNPNHQFTYSDTMTPYDLVVTRLAPCLWHWQVIERRTGRVIRHAEAEGDQAQTDAMQHGLDALRDIRNGGS